MVGMGSISPTKYANASVGIILRHSVSPATNYPQLCQYTQLEFKRNFHAKHFMPCDSKIVVNLLAQKLPVEH
jgi:hypothetical protein